MHLVVVHQQRHDVAGVEQIAVRIDDAFKTQQIAGRLGRRAFEVVDLLADQVAAMLEGRLRAGDIPAAPALGERGGGGDIGTTGTAQRFAVRVGKDGARAQGGRVLMARMTEEAVAAAGQQRFILGRMLIEEVEGRAELRVEHGNFERPGHGPADVGFVREIEDAGRLGVDQVALHTRLAEDEDLGFDGHAQFIKQPLEPLLGRQGADFVGAALEGGVDRRRAVVRLRRRVVDRRFLEGLDLLRLCAGRQQTGQSDEQEAKRGGHATIMANPPTDSRGYRRMPSCSLRRAAASIWRMRSRETPWSCPMASSVSSSPSSP